MIAGGRFATTIHLEERPMKNRRIISITLFVVGVLLCLYMGLAAGNWGTGVLLGLVLEVGGIIFFRRGK